MATGRIIASVGAATVTVIGASPGAVSAATVIVAVGGAVALGFAGYGVYRAGYGVYRWLSGGDEEPFASSQPQLPPNGKPPQLPGGTGLSMLD